MVLRSLRTRCACAQWRGGVCQKIATTRRPHVAIASAVAPTRGRFCRHAKQRVERVSIRLQPNEVSAIQPANHPEPDAELQSSFEPLRIGFALFALLLGAVASGQL
jgi:hypothetical protein